jgi:hypothetical protein
VERSSHRLSGTADDERGRACFDHPVSHRLQITISEEQFARVAAVAHLRGSSVAAVIRDAIEIAYAVDPERARVAARRVLADEVLNGQETTLRW